MAKQITQKQIFTALIALVEQNPDFVVVADGMTKNSVEVVEFLNSRIEALDKKVTKSNSKVSTEQADTDAKVLSVMTADKRKVAEIAKLVNAEYEVEFTSSKVTASLGRLCSANSVVNIKEGKNSFYALAE